MRSGILIFILVLAGSGSAFAARPVSIEQKLSAPELVMRCSAPVEFNDRHQYVGLEVARGLLANTTLQLSLFRRVDDSYDVLAGEDSITAMGELSSMQGGENPVHLVLDTNSGPEHFLFMLNQDGSGELLWSSATASALTTCVAGLN